ncbi:MAG: hypothetical protein AAGB51_11175 [Planctomycetota bacterium]
MKLTTRSLVLGMIMVACPAFAEPITYQGRLADNGQPADGSYDLIFTLYDVASGGVAVASVEQVGVQLSDGLLTTDLDFGDQVFEGDRWLEIQVRNNGGRSYSTLQPRQPVRPAPSAIDHRLEPWATTPDGLAAGDGASRLTINGTTPFNAFSYLTVDTPAGDNGFGGVYVTGATADAFPFYGLSNPSGGGVAYAYLHGPTGELRIFNQNDEHVVIESDGDVRVAGMLRAQTVQYSQQNIRFLRIPAEGFIADDGLVSAIYGGIGMSIQGQGEARAPLMLPLGANIQSIEFDYYMPLAGRTMTCVLGTRGPTAETSLSVIGSVSSSVSGVDAVRSMTMDTFTNPVVNPVAADYVLVANVSPSWSGSFLRSALVTYTVSQPD